MNRSSNSYTPEILAEQERSPKIMGLEHLLQKSIYLDRDLWIYDAHYGRKNNQAREVP